MLSPLLIGSLVVAEEAEPDPPAKPRGPLTELEQKLQGTWRIGYTVIVEGREFCADTQPGEWYEGYIEIRTDEIPAQIDFVILVQSGERNERTSEGIFYWDGETIVVHAPVPGEARPQDFEKTDGRVLMRLKRDGKSRHPAAHCLNE